MLEKRWENGQIQFTKNLPPLWLFSTGGVPDPFLSLLSSPERTNTHTQQATHDKCGIQRDALCLLLMKRTHA